MKRIMTLLMDGLLVLGVMAGGAGCSTGKPRLTANEREPLPGGAERWTDEIDSSQQSLISPPEKIPAFSKFLLGFAERKFKKELLPGCILTWSTDLGVASGALELYIEKGAAAELDARLVYLLRMQVSCAASCPFAIDVNSVDYKKHAISPEELDALQGRKAVQAVASFSDREKTALAYAVAMTRTPVVFSEALLTAVRSTFSHEEIVAIAALAAKVNYWARFIEALRIKPVGYTDDELLRLDEFRSFDSSDNLVLPDTELDL